MKVKKIICDCGSEDFSSTEDKNRGGNDIRNENIILINARCLKCNTVFLVKMSREDGENLEDYNGK